MKDNRELIHDLTGLRNGLEFLSRRFKVDQIYPTKSLQSFAVAVNRYHLLVEETYGNSNHIEPVQDISSSLSKDLKNLADSFNEGTSRTGAELESQISQSISLVTKLISLHS